MVHHAVPHNIYLQSTAFFKHMTQTSVCLSVWLCRSLYLSLCLSHSWEGTHGLGCTGSVKVRVARAWAGAAWWVRSAVRQGSKSDNLSTQIWEGIWEKKKGVVGWAAYSFQVEFRQALPQTMPPQFPVAAVDAPPTPATRKNVTFVLRIKESQDWD